MIVFKKIRYKNFLSTGNKFTEIDLNRAKSTLVVGHNGSGKSTILDALSFALFGKAHRGITKNQLINSINNKSTEVEVEFSIGKSEYKITRGIKPVVFEIRKDGILINQDSHNKEYQSILEKNILKLNHRSFHQIVVLGSSSFIPFMQLPAQHRREVIEDLLDINVFSKMNYILKERLSILKEKQKRSSSSLELVREKIKNQKRYLKKLQGIAKAEIESKEKNIELILNQLKELEPKKIDDSQNKVDVLEKELNKLDRQIREIEKFDFQFSVKEKTLRKEIKFFKDNHVCPTCDQDIKEDFRLHKQNKAEKKLGELSSGRKMASTKISEITEDMKISKSKLSDFHETIRLENERETLRERQLRSVDKLRKEIAASSDNNDDDIVDAENVMNSLYQEEKSIFEMQIEASDNLAYGIAISELLKDGGIKTKIIKQYLPVINKLVNQYLQTLDFYVSFDLDDTFKETIKSRHRDSFSYDSFSEGEKQRIDLALLFTWRMVAKMKNSVATNLLILDETFDSSLDADGVDNLTKIIDSMENDSNIFVISHKGAILDQYFDKKIEFVKDKNFSEINS